MINIWSLKNNNTKKTQPRKARTTAAQLRLQKDLADLDELPSTMNFVTPNPMDFFKHELTIKPDEGYYKNGSFHFTFQFNTNYPHEPPKVLCTQKIYHPNIDLEGNICLNILREDWKPVLNINSILVGLQYLFLEPNPEDPLNKEAAEVLLNNKALFLRNVASSMKGQIINGVKYDKVM